ncbi:MAG TPA: hypothetical protein VIM59_16080 [Cellvibrio sp.]
MDTLIFSQTAIFRMQQLASCVYHKTGMRHRMATQDGMLSLLKEAGASSDRDIRQYYDAFVLELNKRQLDLLEARNVTMRLPFTGSSVSQVRKAG